MKILMPGETFIIGTVLVLVLYCNQYCTCSNQNIKTTKSPPAVTCQNYKSSLITTCLSCCCCLLFLTFSVLVANPKKLLYTVANPARGLLNREKRTKEKVWQHTPPPTPHTARSEKINKITRRIYRRYAGGRSRVRTRIPSARRLGLWVVE